LVLDHQNALAHAASTWRSTTTGSVKANVEPFPGWDSTQILPPCISMMRLEMASRRFPSPWSVEEQEVCFIVRDHNGQALAYVYFEDEAGRRAAAKPLTRDKARRIAAKC
jgi:hypothetical protein